VTSLGARTDPRTGHLRPPLRVRTAGRKGVVRRCLARGPDGSIDRVTTHRIGGSQWIRHRTVTSSSHRSPIRRRSGSPRSRSRPSCSRPRTPDGPMVGTHGSASRSPTAGSASSSPGCGSSATGTCSATAF
jgi:hypothetical protein